VGEWGATARRSSASNNLAVIKQVGRVEVTTRQILYRIILESEVGARLTGNLYQLATPVACGVFNSGAFNN
jgi:hypothetical protein